MTTVSVAQLERELLRSGGSKAQTAQVTRELLRNGGSRAQTAQVVREILHSRLSAVFLGIKADMAELYFMPGTFIDFSMSSNRALFHDAAHHPVSLGVDGSLPTGTMPLVYLTQVNSDLGPEHFPLNPSTSGALSLLTLDERGNGYGIAPTNPTD